jgi:hypothetical protein
MPSLASGQLPSRVDYVMDGWMTRLLGASSTYLGVMLADWQTAQIHLVLQQLNPGRRSLVCRRRGERMSGKASRAHRVRRRGWGVTTWKRTGRHPPRGLRGSQLSCMLVRRGANAGVIAVSDGCNGCMRERNESRTVGEAVRLPFG